MRELEEYYFLEPFGELCKEVRHGQQMALHANLNRDEQKRSEPFKAIEFMNFANEEPEEKKLTPEEIEHYLDNIFGTSVKK